MTIIKWIVIVVVAMMALCVGIGLVLPRDYALQRSVVIAAEPERVHQLVGDLRQWDQWAPWKEQDPTVETTLGDQTSGVGASQSWTDESGGGWLRVTESDPHTGVAYDMAFVMGEGDDTEEMPSTGAIRYAPVDGGTRVTWSMAGEVTMPVFGGYLAKMLPGQVAPMFDRGLEKLKAGVEALPPMPEPEMLEDAEQEAAGMAAGMKG